MDVGNPTLDQLRVFLAVHDEGSFNAAARKLGRAVSVISYGVGALEDQLGVSLFEREGSRRPVTTNAGRALLSTARSIIDETDSLIAQVRSINAGVETEIALALDVMVPFDTVSAVLERFRQTYPLVDLRLHVETLGAVAALVFDRTADLAIAGPDTPDFGELAQREVGSVELVPVAAPSHPLAQMKSIKAGQAAKYLQLVLSDRSKYTEGKDFSVFSPRNWRLADLGAKRELLIAGSGWGNMPRHAIERDIAAGQLQILPLPEGASVNYRLHAFWRKDHLPGPATSWLLSALEQVL